MKIIATVHQFSDEKNRSALTCRRKRVKGILLNWFEQYTVERHIATIFLAHATTLTGTFSDARLPYLTVFKNWTFSANNYLVCADNVIY